MALNTTSWFPFCGPRNRFSLEELRYLTEELQKVEIVNDINEDLVIEMLRSIAELMAYGDQHDPSYFEAISRKLNKNTISLLVKTKKEEVVSFPLYFQAIQFAFHEDNIIRVAVRALTLSVYNGNTSRHHDLLASILHCAKHLQ